jgi:hypothetical protein
VGVEFVPSGGERHLDAELETIIIDFVQTIRVN